MSNPLNKTPRMHNCAEIYNKNQETTILRGEKVYGMRMHATGEMPAFYKQPPQYPTTVNRRQLGYTPNNMV